MIVGGLRSLLAAFQFFFVWHAFELPGYDFLSAGLGLSLSVIQASAIWVAIFCGFVLPYKFSEALHLDRHVLSGLALSLSLLSFVLLTALLILVEKDWGIAGPWIGQLYWPLMSVISLINLVFGWRWFENNVLDNKHVSRWLKVVVVSSLALTVLALIAVIIAYKPA
ncbi:MAG: hypothetical protein AAF224_14285 [Pseudomonadota bacterium]